MSEGTCSGSSHCGGREHAGRGKHSAVDAHTAWCLVVPRFFIINSYSYTMEGVNDARMYGVAVIMFVVT